MRTRLALIAAGLLLFAIPVWAHHAFAAEFDENKQIKVRGTVTKMEWINPHAWLHISVKGNDGAIVNWDIELGPPNALIKRGWTKNSLPAGTELLVEGYQAKDGSFRANGRDITFPDGKKLFAGSAGTGAPGERDLK
jgi:hypothetical protein